MTRASNSTLISTRLFVPLKASAFDAFAGGGKTWELRLRRRQWSASQLSVGRHVELRCGYSRGRSLWGRILAVEEAESIADLFDAVGHAAVVPRAASRSQAIEIAAEVLGTAHEPVIAFQVALEVRSLRLADDELKCKPLERVVTKRR